MPSDISTRILGNSIHDLAESNLTAFFLTPQAESSISEFKSFPQGANLDASLDKIAESLCAFLNSEGGLLIWGAPAGTKPGGQKFKVCTGPLTPLNIALDKDSIIRKISAKISPLTPNIKFKDVAVTVGHCYIFEVSKSESAPHQKDGIYYMRLDGSNIAAPHYYVEALMKRVSFAKLNGKITFSEIKIGSQYLAIPMIVAISNFSHYLQEKNPSYNITISRGKIIGALEDPNIFQVGVRNSVNGSGNILLFGVPIIEKYFILLNRSNDSIGGSILTVTLSFFGDSSPMVTSIYNITINYSTRPPYYTISVATEMESQNAVDQFAQNNETAMGRTDAVLRAAEGTFIQDYGSLPMSSFLWP
jgi:hypothetical protein